jgi:hypothetical protein
MNLKAYVYHRLYVKCIQIIVRKHIDVVAIS